MIDRLVVEPMTENFLVWRCLHGGALEPANIDHPMSNPEIDWQYIKTRNVPLLKKLITTYGTCALIVRDGDSIVATLRFYPKALCTFIDTEGGLGFCLQQRFPAGPSDRLLEQELLPTCQLSDKTLFVHCLFVIAPDNEPSRYRRKGLATLMVSELVKWGIKNKWNAIEANAYQEIPILYAISGVAGRVFWEKLGFQVIRQDTEPGMNGEILEVILKDAARVGIPIKDARNRYRMRLELSKWLIPEGD
ncbi:MAG: hypothetical protein ACOWWO_17735 [Peptococcaceae bacterium]